MQLLRAVACACALGTASLLLAASAAAQPAPTGSIRGRVLNVSNGSYLNNARVSVQGTTLETFTNQYGEYQLYGVPAGTANVRVFYTGVSPVTKTVTVSAGQTVTANVEVGGAERQEGQVVKLDQFVVAAAKDTDQKSIAINEQRFAPNMKSVVSTDQFGDVTEGNIGEFVKFLPGVAVDYVAADVRNIMLRGISPQYTSVTSDGLPMASAASSGTSRVFELEQVSINNVSRMEVVMSRTPDLAAAALGGSVNLVSRSAFELNHPVLKYRAFGTLNSEYTDLKATPGPGAEKTWKILPGGDFTYANPVNDHFGFTLSGLASMTRNPQYRSNPQWAPNGTNSKSAVSGAVSNATPFLEKYQVQDGPKTNTRYSFGGTMDWKFTERDVLSLNAQDNFYDAPFYNRNLTFDTGTATPVSFDSSHTYGAAGKGNAQFGTSWRHKFGVTFNLGAKLVHTGPVWRVDGAFQYSHASNHYQDDNEGYFEGVTYQLKNLTVNYDGYNGVNPTRITVKDASGAAVDPYDIRNYVLTGTEFNHADSEDVFKTAALNARRSFDWRLPTHVQFGAQVQQEIRDIRGGKINYSVSAANAATIAATQDLTDPIYSQVNPPYGFPRITWADNRKVYDLFRAHPEYFTPSSGNAANAINGSFFLKERISAAYLLGDTRALHNRLRSVYGIRFERTDDEGFGPLSQTVNSVTSLVDRGGHAKNHYAAGYPSINVSYNLTDDLIFRAAYSRSIGRPNLGDIIPKFSLPDPAESASSYTFTVTNATLVPEESNNYDASLEYYFKNTGVFSVNAFRKDFSHFFGSNTVPGTVADLERLGVPDAAQYAGGDIFIKSKFNTGDATVTGYGFAYQQKLAHGFGAYANGTFLHLEGETTADFTNFISKTVNWGFSYDARRISAKLNWNYRGRERMGLLTGSGENGYEYFKPRLYLDANLEYRISNHLGLFINGRNITNVPQDDQRYSPSTPTYAQLYRREKFGAVYTIGIKGEF